MPIFNVVVVEHATKKDKEENDTLERIIDGPRCLVARDAQAAAISAALDLKSEGLDRSRIEVLVQSF